MGQQIRQPTLANRKLPEFVRCPICGVEFYRTAPGRRWCSPECSQLGKRRAGGTQPRHRPQAERNGRNG
jgi:hypothetical protein